MLFGTDLHSQNWDIVESQADMPDIWTYIIMEAIDMSTEGENVRTLCFLLIHYYKIILILPLQSILASHDLKKA